jgi:RNA polymerase-binding transcription factor DksA
MNTSHFKELLEQEKVKLENELATVGRKNPANSADWEAVEKDNDRDTAEDGEVADSMEEFQNNTAILEQLETRLGEVTVALKQIEAGTYGTCTVCGEVIEEDRLEANPAATTCKQHMN